MDYYVVGSLYVVVCTYVVVIAMRITCRRVRSWPKTVVGQTKELEDSSATRKQPVGNAQIGCFARKSDETEREAAFDDSSLRHCARKPQTKVQCSSEGQTEQERRRRRRRSKQTTKS